MATTWTNQTKNTTSYTLQEKSLPMDFLLLESGFFLLLEDGGKLVLEMVDQTNWDYQTKN